MLRLRQVLISILLFVFIISSNILFSKAEIPETIVVNETIFIYDNFNGAGKTYIHGSNLGDMPLFRLTGSGATLSNLTVDDAHFLGVWSAVDIGGTDNTVEYVTLKNSSRYGLTFGSALRGTYRHITIEECQHGISGSSGQTSDWNPSVDCLIEDCYIEGMSVCGIKLKNFLRLTIRNNQIDINSDPSSNKSGIYFAGSDTASKFCLVENNNIFSSTPYRGFGINIHQDYDPNIVFSEGNVVRNNKITGTNIGIRLTGSHFNIYNNEMINVQTEYEVKTLVYGSPTFQPPLDNIVIEYNSSIDTTKLDPENWFGFTYPSQLSYDADIWHTAIHKGEQWDFTVYRVPFLFSNYSLEKLDTIVNLIGSHGGKVILDFHCLNQYTTTPDLIGSPNWVSNWLALAEYYKGSSIVIGFELANEPFTLSRYTGYIDDVSLCNLLYSTAVSIHNINPNKYIVFPPINFLKDSPYPHTLIGLNSVLTTHPYDYGSKSTWSELKAIADYRFGAQISGWDSMFDFVWMGEIEGHDVGSGGATTLALEEQYLTYCIDLALDNKFGFCLWKYNYAHDDGNLNQDTVLEKSKYMDSPVVPIITVSLPPQLIALYSTPSESTISRYTYAIVSYAPKASEISAWRNINPNFKAYRYRNFEQIYVSSSEYTYFRDNGMLLKDINGDYIFNKSYPTTDICVDIGSPLYIEFMRDWVQKNVIDYGYDGLFMDNFVRPTYPPSWNQERGVNPRTGKLYTDEEWFNDSMVLLREVKTTGVKAVGNGIPQADGIYGYWTNEDRCNMIVEAQDGVLIEGPVAWTLQDFNSRNSVQWKQNVDMFDVLIDSGKLVWFSNSGSIDLETEDISRFIYYTYLMVAESSNYSIKFRGSTFMSGNYWTSMVSQDLGLPLTDMTQEGDEYIRSFVEGTIRVNPTTKTSSFVTPETEPSIIIIDGSTKPNTGDLDTKLDLKDTNISGTYETKSIILSTPAINSGLSETANIMVQIIPIFGIVMAVGATSGKVNIKVLLGFLVTIVFVVLFSNIMI